MRNKILKYSLPLIFLWFILAGMLLIINDYTVSFLMPIAPMMYMICFLMVYFARPRAFNSIVVLIIFVMSFIRMVFVPVIYVLSGYISTIETSAGMEYLNEAVLLVGFELFCTTFLILSSKKLSNILYYPIDTELDGDVKIKSYVNWMIIFLVFVSVVTILKERSVLVVVATIFYRFTATSEMIVERRQAFFAAKEESSILFNLFFQTVFFLQILIPASLVSHATNRQNHINQNRGLFLGLIVVALSVLIVTDDNINSVCIMLACLIVLFSAYRERMLKLLPLIMVTVVSFVTLFLFSKVGLTYENEIKLNELSKILCAYFSSFSNVSCGFALQHDNELANFWGDIVAGVPYMVVFFRDYPKSTILFNFFAYGHLGRADQVMPLISSGYQFLRILAPAFTLVVYNMAFNLELKFRKTNKTFNRVLYALMLINLSIGPSILSLSSIIKRLCYYVPLWILAKLNGERYYQRTC